MYGTDIRVLYKDEKFVTRGITINIQDELFFVELIVQNTNYYANNTEHFASDHSRRQTTSK